MDLEDLDMEFDWSQVDILSSINPSLLNNPPCVPQQVNVPSVQDSVGTVVATPHQVQNTEQIFGSPEEANSASMGGNPPQLAMNDPYQLPFPQLSPNSAAPLLDETQSNYYIPSMVELLSEGAGSSVQGQDMTTPTNYCNQFPLMQNNNLSLMHDLGQLNEHNTSNQMLVPNVLENQNFSGINLQSSSYPPFFQQNPVEAGAGNATTNGHFMTNQSSPVFALNNHAINPPSAWNSPRTLWMQDQGNQYNQLLRNPGFQQQGSTLNGPTPLSSSGFTTSSAFNSATLGLSGTMATEGSSSQVFNTQAPQFASLLRPERALGVQLQQVPPLSVNIITPQSAGNGLSISSSFRAQPSVLSLNMLNLNDRSKVPSYGSYSTLQPNSRGQREPPRRGRPRKHFEPGEASSPYKRRKKVSSARENARKIPLSQGNNTPGGVVREDQNQTNASSAATARQFVNLMYDPAFERAGVPIDPLLRLFNATSEKPAGGGGPATTN